MFLLVLLINICVSMLKKENKIIAFFSFIFLGFLAGQTDPIYNLDTANYELDYNMTNSFAYTTRFEWLYARLVKLFLSWQQPYASFRLIIVIIAYLALFFAITFLIKNVSLFYVFFALFAFPIEATQIRTFVMFSFFILAIALLKYETKAAVIGSFVLVIVATGFHTLAFFFAAGWVVIVLMRKHNVMMEKFSTILPYFSFFGTIVLMLLGSSNIVGNVISNLIGVFASNDTVIQNASTLFNSGDSRRNVSICATLFILALLLVYMDRNKDKIKQFSNDVQLIEVRFLTSFASLGLIFMSVSVQYVRILRYGTIILFLYWMMMRERKVAKTSYLLTFLIVASFIIVGMFFYWNNNDSGLIKSVPYLISFTDGKI